VADAHTCLEAGGCQSPADRGSTTETARRIISLLPLAPPPTDASFNDRVGTSFQHVCHATPPIQLQIDPALQATAPPQVTSAPPPSSSIDADAPTLSSHVLDFHRTMGEQRLREEQRERDSARLRNLQKTKHTILVCAWVQVCH
jgi:hypothetical protein